MQQAVSSAPVQEAQERGGGPRVPGRRRASARGSRIRREACVHSVREAPELDGVWIGGWAGGWIDGTLANRHQHQYQHQR